MADTERVRVLVVDDERVIADSLAMILETKGFDARAVYSGEEAADLADTFEPLVVITDVVMPGMSGIDLADWFADNYPACKVVLISGNLATAGMLAKAVHKGHPPILPKPVHPSEILQLLAACIPIP